LLPEGTGSFLISQVFTRAGSSFRFAVILKRRSPARQVLKLAAADSYILGAHGVSWAPRRKTPPETGIPPVEGGYGMHHY